MLGLIVGLVLGLVVPYLLGASLLVTLGCALLAVAARLHSAHHGRCTSSATTAPQQLRRELPDALDLMTISVEAGLSFDAALAQVARNTTGPMAEEFFRVLQEMQIGWGRAEAMRALSDRTDLPELRAFVLAMIQADAFGIPVANVLRIQADEMRVKRSQRAEEAAQKVPVKILFPLIFCIMPALFVGDHGTGGHSDFHLPCGAAVTRVLVVSDDQDPTRIRTAAMGPPPCRRRFTPGWSQVRTTSTP